MEQIKARITSCWSLPETRRIRRACPCHGRDGSAFSVYCSSSRRGNSATREDTEPRQARFHFGRKARRERKRGGCGARPFCCAKSSPIAACRLQSAGHFHFHPKLATCYAPQAAAAA